MEISFRCLLTLSYFTVVTHAQLSWNFVYWEAPPFVYTDSNGSTAGIFKEMYQHVTDVCQIPTVFKPKANLGSYTEFGDLLHNPNISNNYTTIPALANADGSNAAWVPLFHRVDQYESYIRDKKLTLSTLWEIDEGLAVIAKRDKISFTYKVWIGIQNSTILFVMSCLCVIAISVFTWCCVSHVFIFLSLNITMQK